MSRTNKGSKAPGWEYWSRRPMAGCNPCAWVKKATHKAERRQAGPQIAEQLEDVYLYEEFMADICTPETPCDLCIKHARLLNQSLSAKR